MEKRIFIAVMVSIAFLWAWGFFAPRFFPELARKPQKSAPVTAKAAAPSPTAATPSPAAAALQDREMTPSPAATSSMTPVQAEQQITTVVDQLTYRATFSNRGAQLLSFELKSYAGHEGRFVDLVKPREPGRTDFPFAIETGDQSLNRAANSSLYQLQETREGNSRVLHYRLVTSSGIAIDKIFRLADSYRFDFDVTLRGRDVPYRVVIGPGINITPEGKDTQFITTGNAVHQVEGSFKSIAREKAAMLKVLEGQVDFIGLEDNYFLAAIIPKIGGEGVFRAVRLPVEGQKETRKEIYAGVNAVAGRVAGQAFFGPKKAEVLEQFGLDRALNFGWFGWIARFLLTMLIWLYGITKNYGWAIIVLTVIIKILLYPLQHKSIVSMKKMQQVQPKVNAIKDKYKKAKTDADQRQKMNAEMMKLYQVEGINPMSGCLPILLQLPILWAFYGLLSHSIELRGAPFMAWITDLSMRDPYYITPVLMTATMFIQQWMTPTTADPAQRRIFMMMPLIFGFIFKDFPSGLVLYWLVQNILSIAQQMIMNRYWKEHPVELRAAKER